MSNRDEGSSNDIYNGGVIVSLVVITVREQPPPRSTIAITTQLSVNFIYYLLSILPNAQDIDGIEMLFLSDPRCKHIGKQYSHHRLKMSCFCIDSSVALVSYCFVCVVLCMLLLIDWLAQVVVLFSACHLCIISFYQVWTIFILLCNFSMNFFSSFHILVNIKWYWRQYKTLDP